MPAKLRMRMSPKRRIVFRGRIGAQVFHRVYGMGRITDAWGGWFSCRHCNGEVGVPNLSLCPECEVHRETEVVADKPPWYRCRVCRTELHKPSFSLCRDSRCGVPREVFYIKAVGVFEVQFQRFVKAKDVHCDRLEIVKLQKAA
jgi:hypothetical protein